MSDMIPHWVWGAVNALLISSVIFVNGYGKRWGWLLGAFAQLWLITFGLVTGGAQLTFLFSALPMGMFVINWLRHPKRVARQQQRIRPQ